MHKDQIKALAIELSGVKRTSTYGAKRKLNKILNPVPKPKKTEEQVLSHKAR